MLNKVRRFPLHEARVFERVFPASIWPLLGGAHLPIGARAEAGDNSLGCVSLGFDKAVAVLNGAAIQ